MQENNFIYVFTFMKKRVMMISSNKLISTEIKMKTFNEATITELRNDLKNAIKAIEEKHGIAISLGTAKFNDEHLYFSKFTCVINSSKDTNTSSEELVYADNAKNILPLIGMKTDFIGKTFKYGSHTYRFVGLKSNRRNSQAIIKNLDDNKNYKIDTSRLKLITFN